MRLTLRVLLASFRAIESSFDEIVSVLRNTPYHADAIQAAKAVRVAHTEVNRMLDRMMDEGYGS